MPSNIQDNDILEIEMNEWNQTNSGSA